MVQGADRRVLVVEHEYQIKAGLIGERFVERGYELVHHRVVPEELFATPGAADPRFPDPREFDAVIVLGAPWSANDHELLGNWLQAEMAMLRTAHVGQVPVLGVCFGGQLLAATHGGGVHQSPLPEIGWYHVDSHDESVLPSGRWFQWHQDSWTLPPGAREVASNASGSQAFVLGRNLAVQFHSEMTPSNLAALLAGYAGKDARRRGVDPQLLIAETQRHFDEVRPRTRRLVDGFLDHVATAQHPEEEHTPKSA